MRRIGSLLIGWALAFAAGFEPARADQTTEARDEPIKFELDIAYADTRNPRQRLDLYLPKKPSSEKRPVLVFLHGGGWIGGDKSDGAGFLVPFVRSGEYAGVSVGYRLSDEAQWPAQIHDCKAAVRWLRANAEKYGFDPERIGVWGLSAGGHLALMLGVSADDPALEGNLGAHGKVSSGVAAVANYFGVTDMLALVGKLTDIDRRSADAPESKLIGGAIPANTTKARAASPLTYVSSADPPVLTVHGTQDRIVPYDQAVRIDAALKKAGVKSYLVPVVRAGHGDFGGAADSRLKAFFARHLRGQKVDVSTSAIPFEKKR